MLQMNRAWALALLTVLIPLAGCDAPPESTRPANAAADSAIDSATDSAIDTTPVRVWFLRGEALAPAPRPGVDPTVRAALETLVAGPTAEERREGLSSWFGDDTRNVLRDVRSEADRVVVDFHESLPQLIPGAGSSAGSEVLLGALDSTVLQFPGVSAVEYRLGGSCDAFWEWLQRECVVVRR
jgi:spore germination protein GerM